MATKKKETKVGKHKTFTQQKKATVHYSTNAKLNATNDTVVAETQSNRRVIQHSVTEPAKLKSTGFMFALDEIRVGIRKRTLTTIEQCIEQENFAYCSKEDQEQLILIANWYLWEEQP